MLLASHRQRTFQPTRFDIRLLEYKLTGITEDLSHIHTIADAPLSLTVDRKRTFKTGTQIAIAVLQRTETIAIGVQPQRIVIATTHRCLGLHTISQTVNQPDASFCIRIYRGEYAG